MVGNAAPHSECKINCDEKRQKIDDVIAPLCRTDMAGILTGFDVFVLPVSTKVFGFGIPFSLRVAYCC